VAHGIRSSLSVSYSGLRRVSCQSAQARLHTRSLQRGWQLAWPRPNLKRLGVALVPTGAPNHFTEDTPTAILVRQVLGAIAQFDKATLVAKLKAARDRKRARTGQVWRSSRPTIEYQTANSTYGFAPPAKANAAGAISIRTRIQTTKAALNMKTSHRIPLS
jgi:DNA invertase Pin-like site-specific DNA recombinase